MDVDHDTYALIIATPISGIQKRTVHGQSKFLLRYVQCELTQALTWALHAVRHYASKPKYHCPFVFLNNLKHKNIYKAVSSQHQNIQISCVNEAAFWQKKIMHAVPKPYIDIHIPFVYGTGFYKCRASKSPLRFSSGGEQVQIQKFDYSSCRFGSFS